jgi:transcription initiation factor TFIIE subunit alpha
MPSKSITNLVLVRDLLDTIGGQDAVVLVKMCENNRRGITDEEISKKMKARVTEIRTVLNKLHYRGIAEYQKSRNQRTGWYNYTWEIKKKRIAEIIMGQQREVLERLAEKKNLEAEYSVFDCIKCNERTPFEVAAEYNFICPGCGGQMESANTPKKTKELDSKIRKIEQELAVLRRITG